MKPTVGRNVLYTPGRNAAAIPGMVSGVYEDGTTIDVTVNPRGRMPYPLTEVPFSEEPKPEHWHWMEYQKAQRTKAEALEHVQV